MNGEDSAAQARSWLEQEGFDLALLDLPTTAAGPAKEFVPDLDSYDNIVVAYSGGKDATALVLNLLDLGVPAEKIELHHNKVDGAEGSTLMDWPITEGFCIAVARALGVKLTFSWREGGFEREATRLAAPTAPVWIPDEFGGYRKVGGQGPLGTRLKFPQVSADLSVRYCSSALKIDTFARYLCNSERFLNKRTLVLTGERAQESRSRANYQEFEPHRCDTRNSKRVPRHIDTWRAVHKWSERRVWDIMKRWKLCAHPAYHLGWSRCSCRQCIFGNADQWASVRAIAPEQFNKIAGYERVFKVTIHRKKSVVEQADAGTPYAFDPKWVEIANSREFTHPVFTDPWVLPLGAFGDGCGPT